ncbi:MAG: proprotein convertase P-domain-containing protein [Saprospiraceae bacterium]|nr:proprotein convertase P-domain-containing protein [Saprospiraceae bacterium]
MIKRIFLFIALLCLWSLPLSAQYHLISDGSIVDCDGFFVDSGGNLGNYGPNENFTISICPDGSTGTHTRLRFSGVDLQPGDELCFFDGPNILGTSLGCASDYQAGAPFILQASPLNFSGCITVTFMSTSSGQGKGWIADIDCVPACQAFNALITNTDPAVVPADTGWIDICPGTSIDFSAGATFLQNNLLYNQSEGLCTFEWDFGDGNIVNGLNVAHQYDLPGGYVVSLHVRDQLGCGNTNIISRKVRVAPPPKVNIPVLPGPICFQDSLTLTAQVGSIGTSNVQVIPQLSKFELTKIRSDSLALPDGNGASYQTSVYFTEFPSDKVLTDPNQILSICANMEHSWMRDLNITLTCPSGQSVTLVNQEETGDEVFLGNPFEGDELLPEPIPGQGFTYCWTYGATNGTWLEYANANDPGTLPPGDYNTFENLSGLIGCPLNGEWVLTIQDLWEIDNGFIFFWNITFDEILLPNIETFTPNITNLNWVNQPNIYLNKGKEIQATAPTAGEIFFALTYEDEFVCQGDTFVTIAVLPPTHPDCYQCTGDLIITPDTAVCVGDPFSLDASINGFQGMTIPFASYPMVPIGYSTNPPPNPYKGSILVDNVYPLTLSANAAEIESVCFTLRTNPVNNINVFLEAPDGKQLELTTGNGGNGINYINTCFSPNAATGITGNSAPFTGVYLPEGDWNDLTGAPINGDWKLVVSDNFGLNRMGLLESWSINLHAGNQQTYTWAPSNALSCSDCPNPVVNTDSTRIYSLEAEDAYGCTLNASSEITIYPTFDAPELTCGDMSNHTLTINWLAILGAAGYTVNVNQNGWVPPTTNLTHLINGLNNGDSITIQVKVLDINPACPNEIATLGCRFLDCQMYAVVENTVPPSCYSGNDGEAFISAYDGTSPFSYNLDNVKTQGIGYFNSVAAGDHFVIVTDAMGCMDTVYFTLDQPDPIDIQIDIDSVLCYDQKNGGATAMAQGGTSPFQYVWFTVPAVFNAVLTNVKAGSYTLRVTDDNSCIRDTLVTISQPDPILLSFQTDSVSCPGKMDGSATVNPIGGTMPYTYLWSNLQNTKQATGLDMGLYMVTVTDAHQCKTSSTVEVHEGPPNQYQPQSLPVSCYNGMDGTAWVEVIQAPLPVVFAWQDPAMQMSDTALALTPGVFEVIIMDVKGCLDTLSVTIGNPDSIQLSTSSTPVGCQGVIDGTATVNIVSGGSAPFTFLWNDSSGQMTQTAVGLNAGIYSVTVTDAKGCTQKSQVVVGAPGSISTDMSAVEATCINSQDGSAIVMLAGGTPPFSYLWNDAGNSTTDTIMGINPGLYMVTVTDQNGCSVVDSVTITAKAPLILDSINVTPVTCFQGADGTLEAIVSGGSGIYSFQWSDTGAQTSNPAVGLTAGMYGVTITGSLGCQTTGSINLPEPAPILVNIVATPAPCLGQSGGSLTVTPSGGTGPYTYLWSDPLGQTSKVAVDLFAGMYTVTVTDANQCTQVGSGVVAEPSTALTIMAQQSGSGCAGQDQNEITATSSGGSGGGYQYVWNTGDTANPLSGLGPGNFAVTVTDGAGCTAEASVLVQDLPPVLVSVAGMMPSCFGQADGSIGVTFVDGGSGGGIPANYTYTWSTMPAQTGELASGLAGGISYTVTVTDPSGCTTSSTYFLEQPAPITATSTITPVLCFGQKNGQIDLSNITGGSGNYQIIWDPKIINSNGNQALDLATGTYQVTISDDQACSVVHDYFVPQPSPLQITNTNRISPSCQGLTDGSIAIMVSGGTPTYQYLWSNSNMLALNGNLAAGTYSVTITDNAGCTLTSSVQIDEPAPLVLDLDGVSPTCANTKDGRITAIGSGGESPYMYSLNAGPLTPNQVFTPLGPGQYLVRLTDKNGCTAESMVDLIDPLAFEIDLGDDVTIDLGQSITLSFSHNASTLPFVFWQAPYSGTLSCTTCATPVSTPYYTTIYKLVAEDDRGCEAVDFITVWVNANLVVLVPTAFTPNQDGQNDKLLIHGRDGIRIIVFKIFDRWGEQLFEQQDFPINDPLIGWDGTFKGEQMNSGVYIWTLEVEFIDGFKQLFSGQTTLLR